MTIRKFVFLAILLLVLGTARAEEAETDVDNLVFVGRLVAIEELPNPCASGDCIFMDGLWQARYEIERTLVGAYPQREITVRIADHYGFPRAARFEHALLFVGLYSDGPWLHKYQGFGVHRLTDGEWGYCGPEFRPTEGEPHPPKARPLSFDGEVRFRSDGADADPAVLLGSGNYSREDGRIRCKRGLALPELYEVVRKGPLLARGVQLPAWSGD